MENSDIIYQKLIEQIKNTTPQLDNPGTISQSITKKIELISAYNKKRKILHLTSIVSGVAAFLLICLLIINMKEVRSSYATNIYAYSESVSSQNKDFLNIDEIKQTDNRSQKLAFFSLSIKEKMKNKTKKLQVYKTLKLLDKQVR